MNRKQILDKLKDHNLDPYTRESLQQTLHYLLAEGLDSTSSSKSSNYTSKKRSSKNKHSRHASSKGSHTSSS